jgi:hypothetical protein
MTVTEVTVQQSRNFLVATSTGLHAQGGHVPSVAARVLLRIALRLLEVILLMS